MIGIFWLAVFLTLSCFFPFLTLFLYLVAGTIFWAEVAIWMRSVQPHRSLDPVRFIPVWVFTIFPDPVATKVLRWVANG